MTAKRVDVNHAEIRDGLRRCGYCVIDCHEAGRGFPDLLAVTRRTRRIVLLEVKQPGKRANLTDDEAKFHQAFSGPLHIVTSVEDAVKVMEFYEEE